MLGVSSMRVARRLAERHRHECKPRMCSIAREAVIFTPARCNVTV